MTDGSGPVTGAIEIPEGKKAGCLPRAYAPGVVCGLAAEHIEIVPQQEWQALVGQVQLSKLVKQIKDQDGVGSCATESTSQCIELNEILSGQHWEQLNPWFLYYHSSGGRDRGSSIDENLRLAREIGVAPEEVWPRSRGWQTKPSAAAYDAAKAHRVHEFYDVTSVLEMGSCLLCGWPVVFGWSGHSVVATELISSTHFRYANSWGTNWGNNGFGTLALNAVNWNYGAFAVRTTQHDLEI